MGSLTRRLSRDWLKGGLGRLFSGMLLFLILLPLFYLGAREYGALGSLSLSARRQLDLRRDAQGRAEALIYTAESGKESFSADVWPEVRGFLYAAGIIFLLRLLFLLAAYPGRNRRYREILAPLSELALKADELSRMEFGEDKYHLIEDAISQLEADESARLSLGEKDLLGVEAAINNLLLRIRESNRQQARFVSDASHELRTPIAVIGGYADMLARWGKDDQKVLEESVAAIRTETARMKHLVEQLLFLARGDAGRTQLSLETLSLSGLLREAYEEAVMIDENHIYRCQAPEEEICLRADPGLLKQAFRVLIDNAAKFTAPGDEIILSAGRWEGRPYLQVQDTGIGMAEADVGHIFERFYRSDEARSVEGTGLGLSIAKWIVDKHGGHFEILSREDIGTRIRIVL